VHLLLIEDYKPLVRSLQRGLEEEGFTVDVAYDGEGGGRGADKRILFLPEAKLIITIPARNDKMVLHRFDVEEALEKSGIDYLYVTSQAPLTAKKGDTYSYQLAVKSKKGGLKYKVESGPKGMTISDAGRITWSVPPDPEEKESSVIVSIRDATGQEVFHTFTVSIKE
jgi:hypothetical protein